MAAYSLTNTTNVIRTADAVIIPQPGMMIDPITNESVQIWTPDWQAYQDWLAQGNIPDPVN